MTTTTTEQMAAVARELKLRRHVFPGRVLKGRMSQQQADHEIRVMADLLERLMRTDEGEAETTSPTLF